MPKLLFISLLIISQFAVAQKRQLPVKVVAGTKRNFTSGIPGGASGTVYRIKVYIATDKKIEFKNLWIGKLPVPFDVTVMALEIQRKMMMGDTVELEYVDRYRTGIDKGQRKAVPFAYNGAALIECKVGTQTRYFIVPEIKQLPDLKGQ